MLCPFMVFEFLETAKDSLTAINIAEVMVLPLCYMFFDFVSPILGDIAKDFVARRAQCTAMFFKEMVFQFLPRIEVSVPNFFTVLTEVVPPALDIVFLESQLGMKIFVTFHTIVFTKQPVIWNVVGL